MASHLRASWPDAHSAAGGFTLIELPAVSTGKRSAFTIVELLVVVSVIALLMALLAPALDSAIEQALRVKCGANQRQFAIANQMYAQEFKHQFVPIKLQTQGASSASYYEAWYQNKHYAHLMGVHGSRLLPYNNPQTGQSVDMSIIPGDVADLSETPYWPAGLMCPSAPDHRRRDAILWNAQGFNWTVGDWAQAIVIRRNKVQQPSDKAQMTDSNDWHVMGGGDVARQHRANYKRFWDQHGDNDWASDFNALVAYRHTEGAMIAHFDGHVEYYAKQRAWHYLDGDENGADVDRNAMLWDIRP